MKKLLISIFAIGYILNIAAAENIELQTLQNKPLIKSPKNIEARVVAPTRADEGKMFGYCFDIYDGIGLGPNYIGAVVEGVIEIPEELAQKWVGNQVTAVNIGFASSSSKEVNIYITKDLDGEPAVMQRATMTNELDWNIVQLDESYTIDGDAFYIGYQSVLTSASDYPLAIDGIYSELPYGSIIGISYNGVTQYNSYGSQFGSVCLKAEINGDNFAAFDAMMNTFYQPDFVVANEPFAVFFSILNTGLETITGADITCKVNGVEIPDAEITIYGNIASEEDAFRFIPFGNPGYIYIDGLVSKTVGGNTPIEITVNKLKSDNSSGDFGKGVESQILVASTSYDKNVLVEEYTGTWCGWCPRGIVGMKYMEATYGEKGFIGIAVHYRDDMMVESYRQLGAYYYENVGLPTCSMNRTYQFDPSKETLEEYYLDAIQEKSPIKIDVVADYNEETNVLTATSTTEFAFDKTNPPYAIAFVITENKVGPYLQTNYFSGGKYGETLPGYTELGDPTLEMYNEVARLITGSGGLAGSIPSVVAPEQPYTLSVPLPLDDVQDVQKCTVIAMVLNTQTGVVENSAKYVINPAAGVESIEDENLGDGIIRAYNLQGVKMMETGNPDDINNLPKGIYIVNGKKVVVK